MWQVFFKVTSGDAAPLVTDIEKVKAMVKEAVPDALVMDRGRGWSKAVSVRANIQAALSSVDLNEDPRLLTVLQPAPEKDYKTGGSDAIKGDFRRLNEPDTVILFASQARRLEVEVGDEITLQTETMTGRTNTIDVTVIGIAKDMSLLSSWTMFTPKQVTRTLYQLNDNTSGAIWLILPDISQSTQVAEQLRQLFRDKGYRVMDPESKPFFMKFETVMGEDWTGQAIDVTIWEDEVSFLTWVLTAFRTVMAMLISILVVIIAIGIMNAMWNTVRERTREVGTMRAIGMQRGQVLTLFLLEGLVLGMGSTSLGALLGALVAIGLDAARLPVPIDAMKAILLSDTLHLSIQVSSLFTSIFFLTLCTTLATLWPALRAASLRPVVALSHAE